MASSKVTVKDLAEKVGADPKDVRAWLRSEGKGLGKRGKRYEFTKKQVTDLAAKYEAAQKAEADEG